MITTNGVETGLQINFLIAELKIWALGIKLYKNLPAIIAIARFAKFQIERQVGGSSKLRFIKIREASVVRTARTIITRL